MASDGELARRTREGESERRWVVAIPREITKLWQVKDSTGAHRSVGLMVAVLILVGGSTTSSGVRRLGFRVLDEGAEAECGGALYTLEARGVTSLMLILRRILD